MRIPSPSMRIPVGQYWKTWHAPVNTHRHTATAAGKTNPSSPVATPPAMNSTSRTGMPQPSTPNGQRRAHPSSA